jgi:tripartite motif-containing protein 71
VASDGSVYVADFGNNRIQKFTSEGVFASEWGTNGSGDGEFYCPRGVAVASDGSVYVSDTGNNRIQKFSQVQ